jgi:hypothetical protein
MAQTGAESKTPDLQGLKCFFTVGIYILDTMGSESGACHFPLRAGRGWMPLGNLLYLLDSDEKQYTPPIPINHVCQHRELANAREVLDYRCIVSERVPQTLAAGIFTIEATSIKVQPPQRGAT